MMENVNQCNPVWVMLCQILFDNNVKAKCYILITRPATTETKNYTKAVVVFLSESFFLIQTELDEYQYGKIIV